MEEERCLTTQKKAVKQTNLIIWGVLALNETLSGVFGIARQIINKR